MDFRRQKLAGFVPGMVGVFSVNSPSSPILGWICEANSMLGKKVTHTMGTPKPSFFRAFFPIFWGVKPSVFHVFFSVQGHIHIIKNGDESHGRKYNITLNLNNSQHCNHQFCVTTVVKGRGTEDLHGPGERLFVHQTSGCSAKCWVNNLQF